MIIELIEEGMKKISEMDFDGLLEFYPYLYIVSFGFLFYAMRSSKSKYSGRFEELGISAKNKRLSMKSTSQYFEVSNVNPKLLYLSYWRDHFEILGNILSKKFIDVKIVNSFKKSKIRLFYDNLPETVSFEKCPLIKPMQSWIGINQFGDDVIIDFNKFPSLYIDGRPGSGKTTTILTILKSFVQNQKDLKILIVTTKPDFQFLKKEIGERLLLVDMFDGEFVDQVEKIKDVFAEIDKIAQDHRETGNLPRVRYMLVFDEAKDYLAKEKSDSKSTQALKENLINFVYTHIRRNARYLSMPIMVASQTQNEGDLAIPLKMFHLRLASSTNEAMSRILCGDKRLTDLSFTRGKFLLKTPENEHILRVSSS
jgi:hypothetical protein